MRKDNGHSQVRFHLSYENKANTFGQFTRWFQKSEQNSLKFQNQVTSLAKNILQDSIFVTFLSQKTRCYENQ